jgi:hypothetical protein
VIVLALAAGAGAAAWHFTQPITDTDVILDGVGAADRCLHAGITWNCNAAGLGDVGYFPPLQYIPAFAMKRLGFAKLDARHALAALNGVAFVLLGALCWWTLARRGRRAVGALFAAAWLAGGMLWYATTTFGEPLAALLTVLFATSILLRWPLPAVVLTALAAGLSKETAAPFLGILVAGCLVAERRRDWRSVAVGAAAGLGIAILANAELNLFRYGHVWNDFYVPSSRPPARLWPGITAAQLVSPNGGIAWFWGPLAGLGALAGVTAFRHGDRTARIGVALALALLAALAVFFATWYAPFGWQAWGPRLLAPWLPAIVMVALWSAPACGAGLVATRRRRLASVTALAVFGLPQLGAYLDRALPFRLFDDPCVDDTEHYYSCLSHLAWSAKPMLLRGYESLGHGGRPLLAGAYVAALAGLAWVAGRAARGAVAVGSEP